jgi:hypothetical protein
MRSLFAVVLATLAANLPAVAGEIVTNYAQDMSRYPARVQALHFASGLMDATHHIMFGYWTMHFGEPTPVATPFKGQGRIDSFEIPLQCENNELGARDCTIEIVGTPPIGPVCRITDGDRVNLPVACPQSIEFAQ